MSSFIGLKVDGSLFESIRRIEPKRLMNYVLANVAAHVASKGKTSVFSGNPVGVRTGATRESVKFWKRKDGAFGVGPRHAVTSAGVKNPNAYLGALQGKYNYVDELRAIAQESEVQAMVDRLVQAVIDKEAKK